MFRDTFLLPRCNWQVLVERAIDRDHKKNGSCSVPWVPHCVQRKQLQVTKWLHIACEDKVTVNSVWEVKLHDNKQSTSSYEARHVAFYLEGKCFEYKPLNLQESKKKIVSCGHTKCLTLRRLMSYIYGVPILDVSRSHTTTQQSR